MCNDRAMQKPRPDLGLHSATGGNTNVGVVLKYGLEFPAREVMLLLRTAETILISLLVWTERGRNNSYLRKEQTGSK